MCGAYRPPDFTPSSRALHPRFILPWRNDRRHFRAAMKTTIDLPDEIYRPALAKARRHGVTLSDVIATALRSRTRAHMPEKRGAPPRPAAPDPDFSDLRAELGL
jgi:hypothetical protein